MFYTLREFCLSFPLELIHSLKTLLYQVLCTDISVDVVSTFSNHIPYRNNKNLSALTMDLHHVCIKTSISFCDAKKLQFALRNVIHLPPLWYEMQTIFHAVTLTTFKPKNFQRILLKINGQNNVFQICYSACVILTLYPQFSRLPNTSSNRLDNVAHTTLTKLLSGHINTCSRSKLGHWESVSPYH